MCVQRTGPATDRRDQRRDLVAVWGHPCGGSSHQVWQAARDRREQHAKGVDNARRAAGRRYPARVRGQPVDRRVRTCGDPEGSDRKAPAAIAKGFTAPETRERLAQDGNEVVVSTPEQFDAFFRAQMEKWAKVIKDAGIRLE